MFFVASDWETAEGCMSVTLGGESDLLMGGPLETTEWAEEIARATRFLHGQRDMLRGFQNCVAAAAARQPGRPKNLGDS